MHELALFAGAGGGILGGKLLGWTTVCACELDDYARAVLIARQDDGSLPPFPIWDDVRTFDGKPWRGVVDIITGGFPCQDISVAGTGKGLDGERSGLWREMRRIVGEIRPRFVLVENSPALTIRGLGVVLGDLAALGYDARWGVLGAVDAGAPHRRERIWIVAHANLRGRRPDSAGRHDADGQDSERSQANGLSRAIHEPSGPRNMANTDCLRELQPQGCECEERRWAGDSRSDVSDANSIAQRLESIGVGGCSGATVAGSNGGEQYVADSARLGCELAGREPEARRLAVPERGGAVVGDTDGQRGPTGLPEPLARQEGLTGEPDDASAPCGERGSQWWAAEPAVGRMAHGVAARVDRLRCLGNGQVPSVVRLAWRQLSPFANPGRPMKESNACDDARPLGAVASGALFEEPAGKSSVNSKLQKSAE